MVVEVFFENVVEDITFVPISINYDRLIEDVLFVREVLGIPKPKESTTVRCIAYMNSLSDLIDSEIYFLLVCEGSVERN